MKQKTTSIRLEIELGKKAFGFESYVDWMNHADRVWKEFDVSLTQTVCIDQKGRICTYGAHFMQAHEDGAYPIDVYMLRD